PSGFLAAAAAGAQILVTGPGPGIAGTGSRFGTSAMEQVELLHFAAVLGGNPILAIRFSALDPRPRHRTVSHHTLTVLTHVPEPVWVPFPRMRPEMTEASAAAIRQGWKRLLRTQIF